MKFDILIAEDDPDMADLLEELASEAGFRVTVLYTGSEARQRLHRDLPDVLFTDLRLPQPDGLQLLNEARGLNPGMPVVMITGYATVQDAVEGFRNGLFDLITKPFDTEQVRGLLERVRNLLTHERRIEQLDARLAQLDEEPAPVIESRAAQRMLELAEQVAPLELPVLLSGETGTGKGVLARWIHDASPRCEGPYLALNCAAVPETLIENELFGHEKGAFTGATSRKRGLLELADGGTLLLDEINSTRPEVQARLLQFVQERTLLRVGGERPVDVDVRLVVAANEDLAKLVEEGRFRRDLFYRLNVYPIELPPLRERREDIAPLAERFMLRYARELARDVRGFSAGTLDALQGYDWPGNVRELENIVQRAVVLANGEHIERHHLPRELIAGSSASPSDPWPIPPDATLLEVERYWMEHMLRRCQGNKTEAARRLGIDPSTLHRRLRD
ncbi:sigma-54 dependent transcriptional regulator [Thiohalophilus sp.]|uniref:sigma-54-dependent transcriptional regulator n=1 Tax=Thiohalophilus sp. TaxID=3028392 RepID=UPI002ACEFA3D|nr:sigma-54 dependent transcriptional regulator [Thiohalophilus sp.]MDZ7663346.1 sigma-54 dependent transcriptional regulator [Thiohalophilus sp.]